MPINDLTEPEREVVYRALFAAVNAAYFPDWEFPILFGLERDEVRRVLGSWPGIDERDPDVTCAINNALVNLTSYPHQMDRQLAQDVAPRDEILRVFEKWKNGAPVVVRTYTGLPEAMVDCSALQAAGIDASLADDNLVSANWLYSNAVGGVKVMVPVGRVEEALAVLDTTAVTVPGQPDDPDGREDVCAQCGGTEFELHEQGKRMTALTWLTLGLPLVRVRRSRRCRACGASQSTRPT